MHATPKSATASTVAIDLAEDVFELEFADSDARILEHRRLTHAAFAKASRARVPQGAAHRGDQPRAWSAARIRCPHAAGLWNGLRVPHRDWSPGLARWVEVTLTPFQLSIRDMPGCKRRGSRTGC
jgi:hypothetical protein